MINRTENSIGQDGFALITVLLIVALISIIATQLMYQLSLNTQRSSNMLHQAQATAVVWGMESWIKSGLKLDGENSENDHLKEQWAQPLVSVPFEGGNVSGQLLDMQGMINLNNLQETDAEKKKIWQKLVQRYFAHKELDTTLEASVTDWVDTDSELTENGAESDFYLLKQPAYRAANQKMALIQELGLLKGFNEKLIDLVKEDLAALPTQTKINVNTASVFVIMSLADWVTLNMAQQWVNQRQSEPAKEKADFFGFLKTATGFTEEEIKESIPDDVITVESKFFKLTGLVEYGDIRQTVSAIFYRNEQNQVNLVQRWVGITYE